MKTSPNRLSLVTRDHPVKLGPLGRPLRLITSSDDHEFLPAALELLETPASPRRIAFVWIVCLMLVGAMAWSWIAKLDIYAVASGRIQPSGRSKVLQSLDPGKVKVIAVMNGTRVKAGDLLLELDPTDAYAERDGAASDLEALDAEIPRRYAEIETVRANSTVAPDIAFPPNVSTATRTRERNVLTAELANYLSAWNALRAQLAQNVATKNKLMASIAARERLIAVLLQRLKMKRELEARQVGTLAAVLDARQQVETELTNMASDKGQLLEAGAAEFSTERKIDQSQQQFIADQSTKLADAAKQRDHLAQNLTKAVAKAERTRLVAPVDGVVQQLAVTTIGQVVSMGQPLLVIVPQSGPIEIEALVQNNDFGFIEVGQDAVIKIDAFPFGRFGTIDGKIVRVSHDSVYDKEFAAGDAASSPQSQNASTLDTTPKTQGLVYPVTVQLARRSILVDGKEMPLTAGMSATVEIRTGDRRVIDYLLSPLREIVSQAGHER